MKIHRCAAMFTVALIGAAIPSQIYASEPLTLDQAVFLALQTKDPSIRQFEEKALSLKSRAVAESQLPDPQLGVTLQNMPTSFDFTQENMTQLKTSVRQSFPAGRTLALRGERYRAESRAVEQAARLAEVRVVRDTRLAWLEVYYWTQAHKKISENRQAVSELEQAVMADYATGRGAAQQLMRIRLELSLLDDRLIEADRRLEIARADLGRWVGKDAAARGIGDTLPALEHPAPLPVLAQRIHKHPRIRQAESLTDARTKDIEIAEQQFKPDWSVEVAYGVRGGKRDDFWTAGVVMDVPLFTGKRQDKQVAASRRAMKAASLFQQSNLLELRRQLDRTYADWTHLAERIELYERAVVNRALDTTETSRTSYRSGVTDFAELIRARLAELDAELTLIRIRVDHAQAQSRLLFLQGEN